MLNMSAWIKRATKSKTMLFAIALAVFGIIETQIGLLAPFMSKETLGLVTLGVSLIVAVLRVITTQPLKDK